MNQERLGKIAYIRYRGGAQNEPDLIDDRSTGEPLAVVIGEHRIPKGIEEALCDMEVGERRTLTIPSELGYGVYDEKAAQWYLRTAIEDGYSLKKGSILVWTNSEDQSQRPALVTDTTQDGVKIDMNHPFAGKTLEYWVELVDLA